MKTEEIIAFQNALVDGLKKHELMRASIGDPMSAFVKGYRQGYKDAKYVYNLKEDPTKRTDWK